MSKQHPSPISGGGGAAPAQRTRPGAARRILRTVRECLLPAAVLVLIPLASAWNGHSLSRRTARWQEQLEAVETLGRRQDWTGVRFALEQCHGDWEQSLAYLHVVSRHDAADGAETLYRRCEAMAEAEELPDLLSELAALRDQLGALSEMEQLSLGNIL